MADIFQRTLAAAITDIVHNGFDSIDRITFWLDRIRKAAQASLVPAEHMESKLRDTLRSIYRKTIEQGGILKLHRGVSRYTLAQVQPQLRLELDRRIMAAASLIKLNRAEAVEKTLHRFQGWATSIPAGGTKATDKPDVKADIRKSLAKLPFEERRVLIDQGHKFAASLSETLATSGGAIAGIWRSRWRQAGYDYREDHKERDGNLYLVRNNWAMQRGLVKKAGVLYADEITKPGEEVFCRCSYQWVYNLRDLPEDMLTQKGREELARVRIETRRADSIDDDDQASLQPEAPTRNIDRSHDVRWMAVKSADGRVTYVDDTLPTEIINNGKALDPAEPLDEHETAEWNEIEQLVAVFRAMHGRGPSDVERKQIYLSAHYRRGNVAEREWLERNGYSWPEWEAWCRGELSRLEHRRIANPPPDPHVKPMPHDRRELEEVV